MANNPEPFDYFTVVVAIPEHNLLPGDLVEIPWDAGEVIGSYRKHGTDATPFQALANSGVLRPVASGHARFRLELVR